MADMASKSSLVAGLMAIVPCKGEGVSQHCKRDVITVIVKNSIGWKDFIDFPFFTQDRFVGTISHEASFGKGLIYEQNVLWCFAIELVIIKVCNYTNSIF
jgi:hypothetical protein